MYWILLAATSKVPQEKCTQAVSCKRWFERGNLSKGCTCGLKHFSSTHCFVDSESQPSGQKREVLFTANHIFSDDLKVATSSLRENRKNTKSRVFKHKDGETVGCGYTNMKINQKPWEILRVLHWQRNYKPGQQRLV